MKITEKSAIKEVIKKHPEIVSVFEKYELGCVGCPAAASETIENIAEIHDINLKTFIRDLNKAIENA